MMKSEQQTALLHEAARLSGMDGHVQNVGCTAAERVMQMFGGNRYTPRKMSYLYCDSVDACFYYNGNRACVVFTARWFQGSKDFERLQAAGVLMRTMLDNMQMLADRDFVDDEEV